MWLALILVAPLLHREILAPAEVQAPEPDPQPTKSKWTLQECQVQERKPESCVCQAEYQICQPLRLSAQANGSVTLPCRFAHDWDGQKAAQVHWRLGHFHSPHFIFNCCASQQHTDPAFRGRVSLAWGEEEEEGGRRQYTAAIRITKLQESDSGLYFCRVSVGEREWQTINGTDLTVVAECCQKRTWTRRTASGEQEEKEAEYLELHCTGARAPPLEKPASQPPPCLPQAPGEPGLFYATLKLSEAPNKQVGGRAVEETTYAAVRHLGRGHRADPLAFPRPPPLTGAGV